jgi:Xaa-Pro aminopeptidase
MAHTALPDALHHSLGEALAVTGQAVGLEDALAMLAGLNGCPQQGDAVDEAMWPRLFAPSPTPTLIQALTAARVALADAVTPVTPLTERLALLRTELARQGLDGFVIPHGDEHQSEFIPAASERLTWLTGFTGSAGVAVVLAQKAAVFIDGRYTLQVRDQVDTDAYENLHLIENPAPDWVAATLPEGAKLGLDPWLHSSDAVARMEAAVAKAGGSLVLVEANPVDAVWLARPARPLAPVVPHPEQYTGEASEAKRQRLADGLTEAGTKAAVLSQPDSLAWLLNIRGGDVAHTPLPLSFGVLRDDGQVALFCDPRKLLPETRDHLGNGVSIRPLAALGEELDRLGQDEATVLADSSATPAWILNRLREAGAVLRAGSDPCVAPRAAKNAVELAGSRAAHIRDGVAITRFLAWIDAHGPSGIVGEAQAADQLLAFREQVEGFKDQSFPTISGFGPNGAIVHYRATEATDRKLQPGSLYLCDSGGQFPDGTTDITRTVAIGEPTDAMRRAFTRVLQGNIGLATVKFPLGTTGMQLDALAREPLWRDGLDFDHGTGHGVGSYLGVHEGPQRIAKSGATVLVPGMIISNEPGYYETGAFGIRTENLLAVKAAEPAEAGGRAFLEFEVLTFAPIDRRAIDTSLMSQRELDWLNQYHAQVLALIGPSLGAETRPWLEAATTPL